MSALPEARLRARSARACRRRWPGARPRHPTARRRPVLRGRARRGPRDGQRASVACGAARDLPRAVLVSARRRAPRRLPEPRPPPGRRWVRGARARLPRARARRLPSRSATWATGSTTSCAPNRRGKTTTSSPTSRASNGRSSKPSTPPTPKLDVSTLATATPDDWAGARLVFQPSLHRLALRYPAHELRGKVRSGGNPPRPERRDASVVISGRVWVTKGRRPTTAPCSTWTSSPPRSTSSRRLSRGATLSAAGEEVAASEGSHGGPSLEDRVGGVVPAVGGVRLDRARRVRRGRRAGDLGRPCVVRRRAAARVRVEVEGVVGLRLEALGARVEADVLDDRDEQFATAGSTSSLCEVSMSASVTFPSGRSSSGRRWSPRSPGGPGARCRSRRAPRRGASRRWPGGPPRFVRAPRGASRPRRRPRRRRAA